MKRLTRKKKPKVKWKTVSMPRDLAEDIKAVIAELGYWPSLGAFIREAALEKLKRLRQPPARTSMVDIFDE